MLNNSSVVDLMIASELKLGRIAGPFSAPPFEDFVISPLGLIPKKEPGAFRLIHDLSFPKGDSVNSGIPREYCSVSYEDYGYFVSILAAYEGRGCYIAKADIESAFRIIPISPLDYHLLGFMVDGQYFMPDAYQWAARFHVSCLKGLAVPFSGFYRNLSMCRQCHIY